MFRPLILAGNSGAGKDSLAEGMTSKDSDFLVSKARITTRKPRENETSMTFIDEATFRAREKTGQIIGAYEGIGGKWYGIDTDILRSELEHHNPILPFGGDVLDIQEKYLMDLAWFCRKNNYPIPLYFILHRNNRENQEQGIMKRDLPSTETKSRINRINNRNDQIGKGAITRHYLGLQEASNFEGNTDFSAEHLLWLFTTLNKNLGDGKRFFRKRHERP